MIDDVTTGSGVTIDRVHHITHEGYMFEGVATATAAANTAVYALFRTASAASEVAPHCLFTVSCTGAGKFSLFESPSPSTSTGQSTITIQNHYQGSTNTTLCKMFAPVGAVIGGTSTGTRITTMIVGGGTAGPGGSGATIGETGATREEWILKSATTYALQFVNANGANTTDVALRVNFCPGRNQ